MIIRTVKPASRNGDSSRRGSPYEEKTGEQVLVSTSFDGVLMRVDEQGWGAKVRRMRRDPTLKFARRMYMAPILAAEWSVVADDPRYEDAVPLIYDAVMPHRRAFLRSVIRGLMDWGWQGYERVYKYTKQGYVSLRSLKPLLQDITYVLVDPRGNFVGLRNVPVGLAQVATYSYPWVDLVKSECLLFSQDVEGTNLYGEATMRACEIPYDSWNECEEAAKRFDTKMAGAHWVLRYPVGSTMYNGVETDNATIAQDILNALRSSGRVALPIKYDKLIDALNENNLSLDENHMPWKLELLGAPGSAESAFVGRQSYHDKLKVRGVGLPERAVIEGEFGTKAEAEAHADFAVDSLEMSHAEILEDFNTTAVDDLLRLNKGQDYVGKVRVQASPLADDKKQMLRELYTGILSDPDRAKAEYAVIDLDAMREHLGVPVRADAQRHAQLRDVDENRRAAGSGEFADKSRMQWKRNMKAIDDVLGDVESGKRTPAMGVTMLQTLGLTPEKSQALVDEVSRPET